MTEAYPLHWPENKPRTKYREDSRFKVGSFAVVRDKLFAELQRLGAQYVVLSTNIELRQDGLPYANRRNPTDPGVAVYFQYKKKSMCFSCDRWNKIEDNMQAVHHTIEALRGIARWGTGDMMEAAFSGFVALEGPRTKQWWEVLNADKDWTLEHIESSYRSLAREAHPDNGGSNERMIELNAAIAQARKEKGYGR